MGETISLYIKSPDLLPAMPQRTRIAGSDVNTDDEMKYEKPIDLEIGDNLVSTPLETGNEPFGILILDSDKNNITSDLKTGFVLIGGFWKVAIYTSDALTNLKLKLLY